MSLLENLKRPLLHLAPPDVSTEEWVRSTVKKPASLIERVRGDGVSDTPELRRILALQRRPPVELGGKYEDPDGVKRDHEPSARALALVKLMTERLTRGPRRCKCHELRPDLASPCITQLLPAQAWALWEAGVNDGLFGAIGVGYGKTGMDVLAPMVMKDCHVAVLLMPPGLVAQFIAAYVLWREHFHVPSLVVPKGYSVPGGGIIAGRPVMHIVPYSRLSRAENTAMLATLGADLYISDEGHRLRYPNTSTTSRVLRVWDQAREREERTPRLCIWSGTLLTKTIKDVTHMFALTHGEGSPLPIVSEVVDEWSATLDPSPMPAPQGELRRLCEPGERLYDAVHRRLAETQGVIFTRASAVDAALTITERKAPRLPASLRRHLQTLRDEGRRPDGELYLDQMEIARCARQLAQGFYYYWIYPRGEPAAVIDEWFNARQAWHSEAREKLKAREEHLDSPLLLQYAAERYLRGYKGPLPTWQSDTWEHWKRVKDTVHHETAVERVDDYLVQNAVEYLRGRPGVVWCQERGFRDWCADVSGAPSYGGGDDAADRIVRENGKRSILASIKAHGTGRDGLQFNFSRQLIASPPASADIFEQLLGRLHRQGFTGDEVETEVYRHTTEMRHAVDQALRQAKFVEGLTTNLQKLLFADLNFSVDKDERAE